ncbi:MAG: hypothetical protein FJ398_22445 [Verrucomicrobia bacterium]|nr:hypothetical protein [Verrucomicrobiota bacterium]
MTGSTAGCSRASTPSSRADASSTCYRTPASNTSRPAAPPPAVPALKEKHIRIGYGDTGFTYESLFGDYLKGAKEITVEDPYIRVPHQLSNFLRFCELVVKVGTAQVINLVTGFDGRVFSDRTARPGAALPALHATREGSTNPAAATGMAASRTASAAFDEPRPVDPILRTQHESVVKTPKLPRLQINRLHRKTPSSCESRAKRHLWSGSDI